MEPSPIRVLVQFHVPADFIGDKDSNNPKKPKEYHSFFVLNGPTIHSMVLTPFYETLRSDLWRETLAESIFVDKLGLQDMYRLHRSWGSMIKPEVVSLLL